MTPVFRQIGLCSEKASPPKRLPSLTTANLSMDSPRESMEASTSFTATEHDSLCLNPLGGQGFGQPQRQSAPAAGFGQPQGSTPSISGVDLASLTRSELLDNKINQF